MCSQLNLPWPSNTPHSGRRVVLDGVGCRWYMCALCVCVPAGQKYKKSDAEVALARHYYYSCCTAVGNCWELPIGIYLPSAFGIYFVRGNYYGVFVYPQIIRTAYIISYSTSVVVFRLYEVTLTKAHTTNCCTDVATRRGGFPCGEGGRHTTAVVTQKATGCSGSK